MSSTYAPINAKPKGEAWGSGNPQEFNCDVYPSDLIGALLTVCIQLYMSLYLYGSSSCEYKLHVSAGHLVIFTANFSHLHY